MKRRAVRAWLAAALFVTVAVPAAAEPRRVSLVQAVGRARQNPLARAALERTRAAQAQADEARGARWPRLVVTSFIAPSPDIRCQNADCTRTEPKDPQFGVAGLFGGVRAELYQPLFTFGKIDSTIDAAASAARMQEALAEGVARDLGVDAARAYLGVKLAREVAAMLEDGRQRLVKGKATLEERLEQGDPDVTVQDRLRLETFDAEIRARASEARENEGIALSALRALVGDDSVDTDASPLEPLAFQAQSPKSYVERAGLKRPELRAAREGVSALEGLKRAEEARWLPDFFLAAGFNWAAAQGVDDTPSAFANDPFNTRTAQAGLAMRWTLEPAAQAARVDRARAELDRGRALLAAAGRAGTFAVLQAHTRAVEAHTRLEAARDGERSARGWVASVLQADAIGTASAKDLADAYLAYFTLHGRALQSTYDFNVAVVALRSAIGESPLPPH